MGTLLVSALIPSYRRILLDPSPGKWWLDADFLRFVNQAQRAICLLKTEAYTALGPISMVAGTHQNGPAGCTGILDLYENVGNGQRRVTMIPRDTHDASQRFWPGATPIAAVEEWTIDNRDPTRFTISPPNDGTGAVNGLYGLVPPTLAAVGNSISLPDTYEMVIQSFVIARAYEENTERQDLAKSTKYDNEWKTLLGVRTQAQIGVTQKSARPAGE